MSIPKLLAAHCAVRTGWRFPPKALMTPTTIIWQGEPWTVASDGTRMALVRGDRGYAPNPDYPPMILDTLPTDPGAVVDLVALQRWLDCPPMDGPCPVCHDQPVVCDECNGAGESECTCRDCGHEHEAECEQCGGSGTTPCDRCSVVGLTLERVTIDGVPFNRAVLRAALRYLDAPTVRVVTGGYSAANVPSPTVFAVPSGDVRVLVMPLLRTDADGACPTFRTGGDHE